MTKKKMGSLGKLSQFSGIKRQEEESATSSELTPSASVEPPVEEASQLPSLPKEKLVVVNIKITRAQQEWLTNTARTVRENNLEPVPPSLRVFPQHLIGVAIDLLSKAEVDWSQVQNIEDLRHWLNIL